MDVCWCQEHALFGLLFSVGRTVYRSQAQLYGICVYVLGVYFGMGCIRLDVFHVAPVAQGKITVAAFEKTNKPSSDFVPVADIIEHGELPMKLLN